MNVLAIDTATYVMGVSIIKDGIPIAEMITNEKKNHSIRLMPAIRSLFNEVDIEPEELDRIVVSEGPGSYTGVRIGVTTAKTMAWALKIPIVGISSLNILAQNGRHFNGVISPFFDARRGQVFTGLYQPANGRVQREKADRIILHSDWLTSLKEEGKSVLFLSPDMEKHEEMIRDKVGELAVFGTAVDCLPRPSELGLLGIESAVEEDTHSFSPNYLRLAEAETKWVEANKKREKLEVKGE